MQSAPLKMRPEIKDDFLRLEVPTRRLFSVALVVMLLLGCASGPYFHQMAHLIPSLNGDYGRVYFYGTNSFGGGSWVKANGTEIGAIGWPWSFFFVDLPSGEYEFTTFNITQPQKVTLSPGETKYFEMMGKFVGVDLLPTAAEEGMATLAKCRYMGPDLSKRK